MAYSVLERMQQELKEKKVDFDLCFSTPTTLKENVTELSNEYDALRNRNNYGENINHSYSNGTFSSVSV